MIENNQVLLLFLKQLQKIPYLASKNLYLVTQYFLDLKDQDVEQFCNILKSLKQNTEKCTICFVWKEVNKDCSYCVSHKRNKDIICVVETWRDLIAIEKTGAYQGQYHVLGGAICPLDGISPQDLTINQLINRINHDCKEVILALNQTPEGEATASYIASKIKNDAIKVSCVARGLPVGSVLESMDRLTVSKALSERRPF